MPNAMTLLEETIRKELEPSIEAMGFYLVEARVVKTKGSAIVRAVIDSARGVGIEDCASVSRAVQPKLELLEELGNFSLEVSSPGIGREIKNRLEYAIFTGRGVAVLLNGRSEWINGVIDHAGEASLFLRVRKELLEIPFQEIKRTKLAFVVDKEEEKNNVL